MPLGIEIYQVKCFRCPEWIQRYHGWIRKGDKPIGTYMEVSEWFQKVPDFSVVPESSERGNPPSLGPGGTHPRAKWASRPAGCRWPSWRWRVLPPFGLGMVGRSFPLPIPIHLGTFLFGSSMSMTRFDRESN
jgi:hypothetical protein